MAQVPPAVQDPNALAWIDLEMSGLDTVNDRILEVATIVTDAELNIVAEGPVLVVHQPDSVLDGIDRKSTRLNSSHPSRSRMPSSA